MDFDDDDDGAANVEEEDHGEYAADAPTARKPDGPRKKLKRRERARTPIELDDEEKDRRAEARRKKELEKLAKEKSTMYVHDSDDEDDEERDAEFFAREESLRQEMMKAFGKSLVLATTEAVISKKRKAEEVTPVSKRRRTPPKRKSQPFADSDDDTDEEVEGAISVSSRALSTDARDVLPNESEDEATDTPLSSQHANGVHKSEEKTPVKDPVSSTSKRQEDVVMADVDDEDEDVPVVRRTMVRNTRAGFIVDSDSE